MGPGPKLPDGESVADGSSPRHGWERLQTLTPSRRSAFVKRVKTAKLSPGIAPMWIPIAFPSSPITRAPESPSSV